jgi:hypothetical protein
MRRKVDYVIGTIILYFGIFILWQVKYEGVIFEMDVQKLSRDFVF